MSAEDKIKAVEDRIRVWLDYEYERAPHPSQISFHLHLHRHMDDMLADVRKLFEGEPDAAQEGQVPQNDGAEHQGNDVSGVSAETGSGSVPEPSQTVPGQETPQA